MAQKSVEWGTAIGNAKHETRFSMGTRMFYHPSEQSQPIRFNTTQSYKASGACPDMSAEIMMAEAKANLWEECLIDLPLNKGENSATTGRTYGLFCIGLSQSYFNPKTSQYIKKLCWRRAERILFYFITK